jgi:hypothetical protein
MAGTVPYCGGKLVMEKEKWGCNVSSESSAIAEFTGRLGI